MENTKNYNKDYPPIDCECGCEEKEMRNTVYQDDIAVEYFLHCKKCGQYLGYFAYGHWEY